MVWGYKYFIYLVLRVSSIEGAGAGAVDDVLITRGAVTSEHRSSHVSDDNQAMRPLLVALSL